MSSTGDNIGMMEGAFFVGRKAILDWVNEFLALNLGRIEETCTGAIACQLCDSLYPGKINMAKVSDVCVFTHTAPTHATNNSFLWFSFFSLSPTRYGGMQKLTLNTFKITKCCKIVSTKWAFPKRFQFNC